VGLGSRRLRVHDTTTGADQPFISNCENFILVFNGAIYNYLELKRDLVSKGCVFKTKSDSEVLLQGHILYGESFVRKLEGMFSYVIYDKSKNVIDIYRDHLGIKPLYYYNKNNLFIASSEIKPIIAHPEVKKCLNAAVLPEFFAFQSVMPPNTFFEDIFVVLPASHLRLKLDFNTKLYFNSYWDLYAGRDFKSDMTLEDVIEENIKNTWFTDREIGVQLSGGVDSSLIVSILKEKINIEKINTFSVIFDDKNSKYYLPRSEEKFIDEVVEKYNLNSHKFLFSPHEIKEALPKSIWQYEAPIPGASTSLYYLLAQKIKEHVDVVITGEAVDDIFNGYFNDWTFTDDSNSHFKFFVSENKINKLFHLTEQNHPLKNIRSILENESVKRMTPIQKTTIISLKGGLQSLLARHDRMFMSNGIEGRPPFASKNIIEQRFILEDDLINSNGIGKRIIKKIAEKYYSKSFVHRPKIGFSSPYGDWLADKNYWGNYWKYLDLEMLSQYMNVDPIVNLLNSEDNKQKWSGDNLNFLWCVMNFQLFYSLYFEKEKSDLLLGLN